MKNALSLVCMSLAGILLSTSSFAQSNTLFNPDYNGDGFIGVDDILGALSFYDTAWDGSVSPSWTCGETITYAGVGYSTVQIGDQCWFAENLRTTTYLNGDTIPQNLNDADWSSTTSGAMAFYVNGAALGGLYNWYAVADARGLCPSGWHVPTDGEWTVITDHLGGEGIAGSQMKAVYGWCGGGNGTNSSGFSGLPGGYRDDSIGFIAVAAGTDGFWWSSSPNGSNAWSRFLLSDGELVNRFNFNLRYGFSVRCVRDADFSPIQGCTDPAYLEYDAAANTDDGSCATLIVNGCTDPAYLEYDASANVDDGSCLTFTCGNSVTYQGYDYATLLIGDQCWFAENLRNENYENGDAIPAGLSDSEWSSTTSGATAVYGEGNNTCYTPPDTDACDEAWSLNEYGRLYNWYAVDDVRGLCPSGWHVPTDGEWMTMEMALGMSGSEANSTGWRGTDQGNQMKTTYGWLDGGNGTNSSGFSGLPGGGRYSSNGFFYNAGYLGGWWSSSPSGSDAWLRNLSLLNEDVARDYGSRRGGFSVRCVRDAE